MPGKLWETCSDFPTLVPDICVDFPTSALNPQPAPPSPPEGNARPALSCDGGGQGERGLDRWEARGTPVGREEGAVRSLGNVGSYDRLK